MICTSNKIYCKVLMQAHRFVKRSEVRHKNFLVRRNYSLQEVKNLFHSLEKLDFALVYEGSLRLKL
jgi:hypothetical protein